MKTYNLTEASVLLGVSRQALYGWIRQHGCPVVSMADRSRGVEWQISVADVVRWRTKRAVASAIGGYEGDGGSVTKDEADRRRAVAQAITAEVAADETLDLVVGRSDAQSDVAAFAGAIKLALNAAARQIAPQAAQITSAAMIQSVCEAEINRAFDAAQAELAAAWGQHG